jgi:hypothetical protein
MKKNIPHDETLVYRTNLLSRIFMLFGYYWLIFTALLFLPVFLGGVVLCLASLMGFLQYENSAISYTTSEAWLYLAVSGSISAGIIYYLVKTARQLFKPNLVYEGLIYEKESRDYDEGLCYFIKLKNCEKDRIEVNEKTYKRLNEGHRVRVHYSLKLDQAIRIIRH